MCVTVCERQTERALLYLIFAKDISLGNAEQQGIGNLPSSASHQNSNRLRLQRHKAVSTLNNDFGTTFCLKLTFIL